MERPKPTIGYILDNTAIGNDLVHTKVFRHEAEKELECASLVVDTSATADIYGDTDAITELQSLQGKNLLMMVITTASHDRQPPYHNAEAVNQVRKAIGTEIPIFGFDSSLDSDRLMQVDDNVTIVNPSSPLLIEQVSRLRDGNTGVQQELRRRAAPEIEAILEAHRANFPDMTVDDNTRLVLGALRWRGRVLPPDIIAEEFDAKLEKGVAMRPVEKSVYGEDIQRLQDLSEEKREELKATFKRYKSDPQYYTHCFGFAIDHETLMYEVTHGYGAHLKAATRLEEVLQLAEAMKYRTKSTFSRNSDSRDSILRGIVFEPMEGFHTPFLKILKLHNQEVTPEAMQKVRNHLLKEKKVIPITDDIKPL